MKIRWWALGLLGLVCAAPYVLSQQPNAHTKTRVIKQTNIDRDKIARGVRGFGYNCNEVLSATRLTQDHHGENYRVRCMATDASTFDFRVTVLPNRAVAVLPWL